MGKVVTIYLSDEEAQGLKDFCDENQCTQYSALKTAVKQLLYQPLLLSKDETEDTEEDHQEKVENFDNVVEDTKPDDILEEEVDIVAKIRGRSKVEEKQKPDPDSAVKKILKILEKRKQEQESLSS